MDSKLLTAKVKNTDKALQDIVELSILFDFYSELLGEHNRDILGEYIMNDLSLSEIAEEEGISRQGVHDIIKRSSSKLREYEGKLGLKKRFESIQENAERIQALTERVKLANEEAERIAIAEELTLVTSELISKL